METAALRSLGSRVKGLPANMISSGWLPLYQEVKKRPLSFVKGKRGLCVPDNVCHKNGRFEDLKEQMTQGWDKLDERVRGIIVETCTKSAIVTLWGASVLIVNKSLERLGIVNTGLSNTAKQKEYIAALAKEENEKTLEKLKKQHDEDSARFQKLSTEFDAHRMLTKMWLSHLMVKSLDPLSQQKICKLQEVFALFDKDGDGCITCEARAVLETLGESIDKAQLQKLVVDSGKIGLPNFLNFMAEKVKHAQAMELQGSKLNHEAWRLSL